MKKLMTFCALLAVGTTAFAETVTCKIRPMRAISSGLMPVPDAETFTMTATVTPNASVDSSTFIKNCVTKSISGTAIELCVAEQDFVGGYQVLVATYDRGSKNRPTASIYGFGTSRKNKQLQLIDYAEGLLTTVRENLLNSDINAQEFLTGDSAALDTDIEQGVIKGLIKTGDLMIVGLDIEKSCVLNQK